MASQIRTTRNTSLRSLRHRRASAWQALRTGGKKFFARSAISALIVLAVALSLGSGAIAAGRPITITDLLSLHRVSDPEVSPDGTRVLYTVSVPDAPGNRTAR